MLLGYHSMLVIIYCALQLVLSKTSRIGDTHNMIFSVDPLGK